LQQLTLGTAATVNPLPATPGGTPGASVQLPLGTVLWTANAVNAWGRIENQSFGTGATAVVDTSVFDAATGRINTLTAGIGTATNVLYYRYGWDTIGSLKTRTDYNGDGTTGWVTETFFYDDSVTGVDRLTSYQVLNTSGSVNRTTTLQYNALGDTLYRSDVGVYTYPAQGANSVRPHAVTQLQGASTIAYGYDAQGNLTTASGGAYRSISYTSFNLPDGQSGVLGAAGTRYTWQYDESHARIKEVRVATVATAVTASGPTGTSTGASAGQVAAGTRTTWYMHPDNAGGLGFECEQTVPSSGTASNLSRHYLSAGGIAIGMFEATGTLPAPSGTAPPTISTIVLVKVEYWHKDHLGSVAATTDHTGAVTARYAYDPFGKRRYTTGAYDLAGVLIADYTTGTNSGTARGFTGHEDLDDIGLIHMNGRLYDPMLGRFIQADPHVQSPDNLQSYNRYSYCWNSPLICTDPTGLDFWSDAVGFVGDALGILSGVKEIEAVWRSQLGRELLGIAVAIACEEGCAALYGEIFAGTLGPGEVAAISGFASSMVSSEGNLKAGIEGAITAYAFYKVGSWTDNGGMGFNGGTTVKPGEELKFAEAIAGHAVVGCVSSVAGGGKCGTGALSAGFGELFTPVIAGAAKGFGKFDVVAGTIAASVVGGTASVLGGGKFANGAVTAAFGYLFNYVEDANKKGAHYQFGTADYVGGAEPILDSISAYIRKSYGDVSDWELSCDISSDLKYFGKSIGTGVYFFSVGDYAYSVYHGNYREAAMTAGSAAFGVGGGLLLAGSGWAAACGPYAPACEGGLILFGGFAGTKVGGTGTGWLYDFVNSHPTTLFPQVIGIPLN